MLKSAFKTAEVRGSGSAKGKGSSCVLQYLPFCARLLTWQAEHFQGSSHLHHLITHGMLSVLDREKKLKARVQELVSALERLTKSSEIRHQQSAEFVNDLKRANR